MKESAGKNWQLPRGKKNLLINIFEVYFISVGKNADMVLFFIAIHL